MAKFQASWCGPESTRAMDIVHGISLLAVLATALWNMVLTIKGNATITSMRPIFITTLIAAIIKIPSQLCAAHGRLGGWLTVAGSIVTVIVTAIMVGYLSFDPIYRDDKVEDVCIYAQDKDGKFTKYASKLETAMIKTNGDSSVCNNMSAINPGGFGGFGAQISAPQRGGPIPAKDLYRANFNPAHWSPIFHV